MVQWKISSVASRKPEATSVPTVASPPQKPSQTVNEKIQEATGQLLQYNAPEYRRYLAARAVRCLKESDEERPNPIELQALQQQAGALKHWRRRRRPQVLQASEPPRDSGLPERLQAPVPPHSRWLLDTEARVLFNAFNDTSDNPVENFYLQPTEDEWRTHRYGVYGLRYPEYPNPATVLSPLDCRGLYYRSNKKMVADPDRLRRARKLGLVVTLDHVKAVAVHTVAQIFPKVYGDPDYFNVWPHIDQLLGAALEYFYHYFELRRAEEAVIQLHCRMHDTKLTEARQRRLAELQVEMGTIYAMYLLGIGLPFHHLRQGTEGSGFRSWTASDRQIFEAFLAYVTQVVWITYRRPSITVILREIGRLFRTPGFDPAKRTPPPNLDPMPRAGSSKTSIVSKSGAKVTKNKRNISESNISTSKPSSGSVKQFNNDASQQNASKDKSFSSLRFAGNPITASRGSAGAEKLLKKSSVKSLPPPLLTAVRDSKTTAAASGSSAGASVSTAGRLTPSVSGSVASVTGPAASGSLPGASGSVSGGPAPVASGSVADVTSSVTARLTPAASEVSATGSVTAGEDGAPAVGSAPSSAPARGRPQPHVSMRKVFGLYTGPPPPGGQVFKLLRATTPLLRGALSVHSSVETAGPLPACDRSQLGILGTPLHEYDDVLAAIDWQREEKEQQLRFMGPVSEKHGKSRVVRVIPYLTLQSKFFSPDA